jgi:DNA-binding PucR family transcriptional regulator
MFEKLLTLYKNSILFPAYPAHSVGGYYIFANEQSLEWIGIPKDTISEKELTLLRTLYSEVEFPELNTTSAQNWYEFLLKNGPAPSSSAEATFRFIQFSLKNDRVDRQEMEAAFKGFFSDDVVILWENVVSGIIIEEKKPVTLSEKEILSISDTLETDFYVKISFYIGKMHPFTEELPEKFQQEKKYFTFGQQFLNGITIYTYERVFPAFSSSRLPTEITDRLRAEIMGVFKEDTEMFTTIKAFLENNLNASVTAKKLYIHRNTLQYRIDKFTEKTGITLKDFYGAFTVFLACILFELEIGKEQSAQKKTL